LKEQGVRFHVQHHWLGWNGDGSLRMRTTAGEIAVRTDAIVLALGGGSWPQLGSDGSWVEILRTHGVEVASLQAANCGFDIDWSEHFRQRHAGSPLKPVVAHWRDAHGIAHALQGECVASEYGIEGSLIYAIAADLRETINRDGHALLELDLVPGRELQRLHADLARPRKGRSFGEHLRRAAGVDAAKAALVFEILGKDAGNDPDAVARTLKRLPLHLLRPRPMIEAISTAGGVRLEAMDARLMLRALPGVFCAGEMLDWEAPTGGYLLTACYASALRAAEGVVDWLRVSPSP